MTELLASAPRTALFVDPATLMDDPHAKLAALRAEHPVIRFDARKYTLLRAADVTAMLTDPRTTQIEGADYVRINGIPEGKTARFFREFFLFNNGAEHRAKRGLFSRAFAHGPMRDSRPKVRAVADAIVRQLPRGEMVDFVDAMAARVPSEMIAVILGLPREEARYFASRVYSLAKGLTTVYPIEDHQEIENATADLVGYIEDHLAARLETPREDLLSMLVADWRESGGIPFGSLVNQVLGVIVGGSDTTRAAFAMLTALLLESPGDWQAMRDDPSLIRGAVLEGMRFEPSVGSMPRFTLEPIEVDGVLVPAGVLLGVSTLSALRDPEQYAEPDRFDIRRTDHPRLHPVFGLGPHRCIGEMLARIEMEEALAALLEAGLRIEMQEPPRMLGFGGIRPITPMMVRLS